MQIFLIVFLVIVVLVLIFIFKKAYKLHEIHLFFPLAWTIIGRWKEYDDGTFWIVIEVILWLRFLKWLIEYIISRFDPYFTTFYQVYKLRKAGRYPGQIDLEIVFPELVNSPVFRAIYNHCLNDEEVEEFEFDWEDYLMDMQQCIIMNPDIDPRIYYCTFDEWYEKNQRWKCTNYHHLYYGKQASEYYQDYAEKSKQPEEEQAETDRSYHWFQGINNFDELKKRYRDLVKIYHPDNQAGDTSALQEIQEEYESIIEMYNWG